MYNLVIANDNKYKGDVFRNMPGRKLHTSMGIDFPCLSGKQSIENI